jgi:CheY-like chemotaxis protein
MSVPEDTATPVQDELAELLSRKVVGQPDALRYIVPYLQMAQAGLAPEGRPIGVFLLLGPTGTGKTRTVEVLAEILHGSVRNVIKVDCGEFQSDHEVAKLIGAPPGYLGHRETEPRLTQAKLSAVTSARSDLSLVLFDEIEKAAPSIIPLLLGILDRAILRLGDNTEVSFEKSLIFMTSNLGAREMLSELQPSVGFHPGARDSRDVRGKLESIGLSAVRKRFSPEFVNRLDAVVTYRPLDTDALAAILDEHIADLQQHVHNRLGDRSFNIEVTPGARQFLVAHGTSTQYGARELKRIIHRHLTQPLAGMVAAGQIEPGSSVTAEAPAEGQANLVLRTGQSPVAPVRSRAATILVVDDNQSLVKWLRVILTRAGCRVLTAESVAEAMERAAGESLDAILVDFLLPDGDGVTLAIDLVVRAPDAPVLVTSGMALPEEEALICRRYNFGMLLKPFLAQDVLSFVAAHRLQRSTAAKASG